MFSGYVISYFLYYTEWVSRVGLLRFVEVNKNYCGFFFFFFLVIFLILNFLCYIEFVVVIFFIFFFSFTFLYPHIDEITTVLCLVQVLFIF